MSIEGKMDSSQRSEQEVNNNVTYIPNEIAIYVRRVRNYELPLFCGTQPMHVFDWTSHMSRIFRMIAVPGCLKLDIANLYFSGEASQWFDRRGADPILC